MFKIVVYYFQWNETLRDVVQIEEAIFSVKSYWEFPTGRLIILTTNDIEIILPTNKYVQIIPIKEVEKEDK